MTGPRASEGGSGDVTRAVAMTPSARPYDGSIHALFEVQAARRPDAVAIRFGDRRVSYRELNERANQLAHALQRRGVGPETPVGLCVERIIEMIVGILGILKAGGAYVPLDPTYPASRRDLMVRDTCAPVLLSQASLDGVLPAFDGAVIHLDADAPEIAQSPTTNPIASTSADTLAYVMYTSGSTGRPKGVSVTHRNVVRLVRDTNYIDVGPDDVFLQVAPISFDASTLELWGALLNGATLVVYPPRAIAIDELGRAIEAEGITTLWLTSALFQRMVDEAPERLRGVRQLLAGGDVLSVPHVERVIRSLDGDRRLINGYGPTENTTFTCCHVMDAASTIDGTVPIGRPIAHTHVHILDDAMREVPTGEPGELYAGGAGVARGYLNAPAATAERFVPDPFGDQPGARLYRTGDLARRREDGTIEFIGRVDRQIKLRGFRIELGEIEAALRADPAVRDAVVLCREDAPGDRRLVAYIVATGDAADATAVRARLGERLPDHMVPAAFMTLDAFPITPNGKVDHHALPAPDGERSVATAYAAPRGSTESAIATVFADVLHLDEVGAHDDFFDLGGHSLTATMVASRVRETTGGDITMGSIFAHPTVAELATLIGGAEADDAAVDRIVPVPRDQPLPLSFSQERVWFLTQLDPESYAYNFQGSIRFRGNLDVPALERALSEMIRRHEILRTSFHSSDGGPVQVVQAPMPCALPIQDLRDVPADEREQRVGDLLMREGQRLYDLGQAPLIRWLMLRADDDDWVLGHFEHHMVHDGWGFVVFLRELAEIYTAFANGRPSPLEDPPQFADFAAWQRRWIESDEAARQTAYWKERLTGTPPALTMPLDHPRPSVQQFKGSSMRAELPGSLCAALRRLSQANGTTFFVTLLSAYFVLLHRYGGQDDICVGTAVANRRLRETEGMLGMFVNNVGVRADLDGNPTFTTLVAQVRKLALGAYANEDLPFDSVVGAVAPDRDPGRNPLFQTMFSFHDTHLGELDFDGLDVCITEGISNGSSKFEFSGIVIPQTPQRIGGRAADARGVTILWEFNTDLFERRTIERLADHYRRLLESIVATPDAPIRDLPIIDEAERHLVLEMWNDTSAAFPVDGCLHELFERRVAEAPDAIAVTFDDRSITYGELDARANQLAHRLRRDGVGAEVPVGICVERSQEMVVGILAILKAGGAYVPLDPAHPAARLAFMLADTRAKLVLTQAHLRDRLPPDVVPTICLDADASTWADEPTTRPTALTTPESAAYVIYTSGSTGHPKGVLITHAAVRNQILAMRDELAIVPDDRLLQKTPLSFDVSVLELFLPLTTGAHLVVARPDGHRDPAYLAKTIDRYGITVMHFVPSMLRAFLEVTDLGAFPNLTRVMCGGEALPADLVNEVRSKTDVRLLNCYGPTETTVGVTTWPCRSREDGGIVRLGLPTANVRLHVLDHAMNPVPPGVPGELHIGGVQLARGYVGRPALTAAQFVPDPFSGVPGARLYATGDLVRHRDDGTIDFLGRIDHQVKVRGHRIELGEIESVLGRHPAVQEVVAIVYDRGPDDRRIAAYVTGDVADQADAFREWAHDQLPDYMVPAVVVPMDRFPRKPSGKVDRKALPVPERLQMTPAPYVAPRTETEIRVADVWKEVLKLDDVGVNGDFFKLGGHSLVATRVLNRLSRMFGVRLRLSLFFQRPTIAGMAAYIDEISNGQTDAGAVGSAGGALQQGEL